jgi:hypothetical protein
MLNLSKSIKHSSCDAYIRLESLHAAICNINVEKCLQLEVASTANRKKFSYAEPDKELIVKNCHDTTEGCVNLKSKSAPMSATQLKLLCGNGWMKTMFFAPLRKFERMNSC